MIGGTRLFRAALALCLTGWGAAAHAELPEAVRKMIAAAEATGDAARAEAVYDAARAAYPEDKAEIDRISEDSRQRLAAAAEARRLAARTDTTGSGIFTHWDGRGEIGAKHSTGNSDEVNFTASILLRRTGLVWRHKLTARAEFESTDGETTTENFLFAYQPDYDIGSHLFLYGLTQFERDQIQGYSERYSLSGGVGYRPFDRPDLRLELKAGPAWRRISFIPDGHEAHFAAHFAGDFEWQFADELKLTEAAGAFLQKGNSTYYTHTGLELGVGKGLKARFSYSIEYDTALPNGVEDVDTTSRFTLLYDF